MIGTHAATLGRLALVYVPEQIIQSECGRRQTVVTRKHLSPNLEPCSRDIVSAVNEKQNESAIDI